MPLVTSQKNKPFNCPWHISVSNSMCYGDFFKRQKKEKELKRQLKIKKIKALT